MASEAQRSAVEAHRRRLADRGLGRFEVRGLPEDKDLIRSIARRLAMDDAGAGALRADLWQRVTGRQTPRTGGILEALRRSPLVDADVDFARDETGGRDPGL